MSHSCIIIIVNDKFMEESIAAFPSIPNHSKHDRLGCLWVCGLCASRWLSVFLNMSKEIRASVCVAITRLLLFILLDMLNLPSSQTNFMPYVFLKLQQLGQISTSAMFVCMEVCQRVIDCLFPYFYVLSSLTACKDFTFRRRISN